MPSWGTKATESDTAYNLMDAMSQDFNVQRLIDGFADPQAYNKVRAVCYVIQRLGFALWPDDEREVQRQLVERGILLLAGMMPRPDGSPSDYLSQWPEHEREAVIEALRQQIEALQQLRTQLK